MQWVRRHINICFLRIVHTKTKNKIIYTLHDYNICNLLRSVCVRFSSKFEQTLLTHINRREYTNMRNILKNTWPIQFFRPDKKRDYFPIYMRWCSSYASTILSLPSQPVIYARPVYIARDVYHFAS